MGGFRVLGVWGGFRVERLGFGGLGARSVGVLGFWVVRCLEEFARFVDFALLKTGLSSLGRLSGRLGVWHARPASLRRNAFRLICRASATLVPVLRLKL